jgi:DNA-binding transcriptional MerR regulator
MAPEPLTLAQLAKSAGLSPNDVIFYQQGGLLQPPRRSTGRNGKLAFHQEHLDRLRLISRALDCGFSLDAIKRIVDFSSLVTCRDILDIANAELQRLRQLKGRDAPTVAALRQLTDSCSGTGGRDDCRIYAALTQDSD